MKSEERTTTAESEVKALRRRLTEAEDTLQAIRAGEVDAVVVENQAGQQVYTLESPDQPFRIFVEQMQEGALTLDSDGTVIYCNHFFADLVGWPVEQVRGQSLDQFIEDDQEHFWQLRAVESEGVTRTESWLRNPRGAPIPVQIALNPLPSEDMPMFGMVVSDLSERERAKQLEAERMAAEEANAARDQFLAVVSHELRTPLNAVLGWTQMLRRQADCPASVKHGLEVIERSAWTQAQLIDDLLDVSRVLAGKLRLDLNPVNLAQSVEISVNSVQPNAESKRIRLTTDFPEQATMVRGDADRLQQIVTNLLSNAVKFTPEQGEVRVHLREVDGRAQIQVTDTGVGIPPDSLPRLFELYQQIEGSTTRRNRGLGLGLAIVKQLTELHGGKVWAESAGEGKGATFTVELPLLEIGVLESESNEGEDAACAVSLEGVHVLLVEDDEVARELLSQVLQESNARVVAVSNASDALAALENEPVHVLISDIALPETDGYALIAKIRESGRSGRDLPAVALTAFAGRDDQRKALLAGFQVHLAKPVDQSELCAVIATLAGVH